MKQQDFDRLKAICEKEGFTIESYSGGKTAIIGVKDIWDGVEFGLLVSQVGNCMEIGKIYKLSLLNNQGRRIWIDNGFLVPSTESAYVDQLKKEAFERFGEIGKGEKIIEPDGNIDYTCKSGICEEWDYDKKNDRLFFHNLILYQAGKWASRVPNRIEVELVNLPTVDVDTLISEYKFKFSRTGIEVNYIKFLSDVTDYMEKYLNNEL